VRGIAFDLVHDVFRAPDSGDVGYVVLSCECVRGVLRWWKVGYNDSDVIMTSAFAEVDCMACVAKARR